MGKKAAPAKKKEGSGGSKAKKKKWSKGKVKEKVVNAVFFDKALYDKCVAEVPKFKLITPSIISERMRVNGSLARRTIKDLMAKGLIRQVYLVYVPLSACVQTTRGHFVTNFFNHLSPSSSSWVCGCHPCV